MKLPKQCIVFNNKKRIRFINIIDKISMNSYVGYVHLKIKARHQEVFLIFYCSEIIYPLNNISY
jgi:hypothetical protein